jgi:hypothetical protein
MDSRHSEAKAQLNRLRDSIRSENWDSADALAHGLSSCSLPPDAGFLGEHLAALKETLILAKASRSNSAASLARIRAAARFQENCQNPADSPDSRQPSASPRLLLSET